MRHGYIFRGEILKKAITVFIVFLFVCSFPLVLSENETSETIYVDDDNQNGTWDGSKEHTFEQIQDGLEYAKDSDIIFVRNGEYVGNLFVENSVKLIGEQREKTIIKSGKHNIWIFSDGVTIKNFTIIDSSRYFSGIYVTSSENTISHNLIYDNYDGILLDNADGNLIVDNRIFQNYDRNIRIEFSDSGKIFSNYIGSGGYGIYLWSSSENRIFDNVLDHCEWGISLGDFCFDNTMYHNTLIENAYGNGFDESENNEWDNGYTIGGNFWSDYDGVDEDNDGIGDRPYELSEEAIDRFPFMQPLNISKPDIVIKSGVGFHAEFENIGSKSISGLISIEVNKRNGETKYSFESMIIDLKASSETEFIENIFGFSLVSATVKFGIWEWEQDAFLIGPIWINI